MPGEVKFESLTFEEAVDYFREKIPVSSAEFAQLAETARARAFTIAKTQNIEAIARVKEEIDKALAEGVTFREFQKEVDSLFDRMGVTRMAPYRLETVFQTNLQSAYQAGRYVQMTHPDVLAARPFWQYHAVADLRTRPEHMEQDGKVYPADHPYWDTWYPPNGFNCRCTVTSKSPEEIEEEELKVSRDLPKEKPGEGFAYNPAKGNYGDLVRKAAQEHEASVIPALSKGYADYGRPKDVPDEFLLRSPGLVLSQTALAKQGMNQAQIRKYYEDIYRRELGIKPGINFVEIKDARGEIINFNLGGLDHILAAGDFRERYLKCLRPTVESPYEVWWVKTQTEKGKTAFRRRYISVFQEAEKRRNFLMVVDRLDQQWGIWTAYPVKRLNSVRKGVFVYGK